VETPRKRIRQRKQRKRLKKLKSWRREAEVNSLVTLGGATTETDTIGIAIDTVGIGTESGATEEEGLGRTA
jgi:hypothetical protein